MPNTAVVARSRQRCGMLLLALGLTFFLQGVAEPGDLQRSIGTLLVGVTLMLAPYAAEVPARRLHVALAIVVAIVLGMIIASVAGKGMTVVGIAAIANGLLIALAPPAVVIGVSQPARDRDGDGDRRRGRALPLHAARDVLLLRVRRDPEFRRRSVLR